LLKFSACGSVTEPTRVAPSTTTAPTVAPNISPNCDFEKNNLCEWNSPDFMVLKPSSYPENLFWPETDHTKDSAYGHFAALWATMGLPKDGMLEVKTSIPAKRMMCLVFAYYLYTDDPSRFTLVAENYQ